VEVILSLFQSVAAMTSWSQTASYRYSDLDIENGESRRVCQAIGAPDQVIVAKVEPPGQSVLLVRQRAGATNVCLFL
jgi:hypothetical protein